jgi:hypothetical protein
MANNVLFKVTSKFTSNELAGFGALLIVYVGNGGPTYKPWGKNITRPVTVSNVALRVGAKAGEIEYVLLGVLIMYVRYVLGWRLNTAGYCDMKTRLYYYNM